MTRLLLRLTHSHENQHGLWLDLDDSPLAQAVTKALETQEREALNARWSGHAICINLGDDFQAPDERPEDIKSDRFELGQIAVSVNHNELVIAYGKVIFFDDEQEEDSPCYLIGWIPEQDYELLKLIGERIWKQGARQVTTSSQP